MSTPTAHKHFKRWSHFNELFQREWLHGDVFAERKTVELRKVDGTKLGKIFYTLKTTFVLH